MPTPPSPIAAKPLDGLLTQRGSIVLQAAVAMLLGVLVVGIAGFSHLDAVHNASHDTRHSNGFPCH